MRNQLRESLSLLPRRSQPWIGIAKPSESRIQEFICGRSLPTAALSVEGPTKDKLRRAIMFSSHLREPMVGQCGLPDASPGNNGNDIDIPVCPSPIQEGDILISTKNITSSNRQSGYGNLLRSKSSLPLANANSRGGRGRLLQALKSDSMPCLDSACYRWYRFKQFSRVLKATPGVFLKEFLKENYDRLWNMFELLNR